MANENVLLQVNNLKKYFKTAKGQLHAVDDITFSLNVGKPWGSWENPDAENPLWGGRFLTYFRPLPVR